MPLCLQQITHRMGEDQTRVFMLKGLRLKSPSQGMADRRQKKKKNNCQSAVLNNF